MIVSYGRSERRTALPLPTPVVSPRITYFRKIIVKMIAKVIIMATTAIAEPLWTSTQEKEVAIGRVRIFSHFKIQR